MFCSISHELRNPINHINGILECVKNYIKDDEHITQFLNTAISSTMMLLNKIDDIMDYSLLETNNLKITKEKFNLRDLLSDVQNILSYQFDNHIINFSVFVADHVPNIVTHDYKRIKQILLNLVFNALKYTEKGFVTVIVDWEFVKRSNKRTIYNYDQQTECILHVSVSDSGWGIEKKKRMNMYELFSSAKSDYYDNKTSKSFIEASELMGMGLAYWHKILKKMDSKLKLCSAINVGSTFNFR